ncbi:MAG TPA: flagellar basal body P-ring protein FlgI, partial [Candidatus Latescibacteria bacterium]|jgi:flagellar P-ring protein precursor FlgI|nr:flagellar biosynthesis protein FlgA [Gemmatimonadota bacterium]MDP7363781.1 flagellar basal body P-ring protein FlgI [Candidatus Latescibacterota bacterium]HCV22077.1 flagellar biosynthesis protein FlgA [Candidatus Latescibacterota bacterium]HJN26557.1 flagellar basal body P-ring protein FlgI [Candidatus Latescibacterota bacterium]|tara:strand:+ start:625 stop:1731 length:1107 start_codon:yes stop_codon:yes gene_type:complete
MHRLTTFFLFTTLLLWPAVSAHAATSVRIKDLARLQVGQEIPLTGMGLVIGLEGTGDGRQASFTLRMLANMMNRLNVTVDPNAIRVRNVAAVSATAILSPYDRKGNHIDVQVASLGDAGSLQGGTLLLTPMAGPDGKVYVQVQGPISIGGFNLGGGGGGTVRKNHSVVGTIPNGGMVVNEPERLIDVNGHVQLTLYEPDWTTAARTAWAIDEYFGEFGLAQAVDAGTIQVRLDPQFSQSHLMTEFMADIEKITVVPDLPARVVVNERTGTVIIGENVSVSSVAMSHGSLKLKIPGDAAEGDLFSGGTEVVEEPDHLHPMINNFDVGAMPTVRELVRNLNALGVTPRDLISILQSLKTAGALRADLIIQ